VIDVTKFGTRDLPIRPSSAGKLVKCPMSVILSYFEDSDGGGNQGAQTGSVVHRGVEAFHRAGGDAVAAKEALAEALKTFPEANRDKAANWLAAYVADPTNQAATVVALEQPVELDYRGVYFKGTLDQIRRDETGALLVWDLKTGSSLEADAAVDEYQFQQAIYVLAARQSLGLEAEPGGLILAAGYDKKYGRRFLPMGVSIADCEAMADEVVEQVLAVRSGLRPFRPSADHCRFCPFKRFPKCRRLASRLLGEQQPRTQTRDA
jgi:RecB family exonuclease